MDSSTQTSAADTNATCVCSELFELVEKLQIELHKNEEELHKKDEELHKKNEQLAKEKQEKQVCNVLFASLYRTNISLLIQKFSLDLALEKVRADKLETDLDSAQEMIDIHQMSLW
jgi:hypothetical protein